MSSASIDIPLTY